MDLKKRLANLDRLSRRPGPTGGEAARPRKDQGDALASLGLEERSIPVGTVWIREHADPLDPPGGVLPDFAGFFSRPRATGVTAADILFLDTETTGLVGGTGTIPFLVGASWWEGRSFRTRQYFLPGPGREAAMLADLADLAKRFTAVVTFNGASFDLPLLRTRARLERREDPLEGRDSWDLLVPCRRLWGRGLPDCRQQTLEREILGRERGAGDIDGSLIPQTWFDFLATGVPGDLTAVMTHNHRDMLGMAGLFRAVAGAAVNLGGTKEDRAHGWVGAWSLGRICEARRESEAAARWLGLALEDLPRSAVHGAMETFFRDAVRILKRTRDWAVVERAIQRGFARGLDGQWLHREAAILYEHRLDRVEDALAHAVRTGEDRRLKRLEMKISRRYRDREPLAKEGKDG